MGCLEVYLQRTAKRQGGGRRPQGVSPLVFSPSITTLRAAVLGDDRGENAARRVGGSGFRISSGSHAFQRRHAPTEGRDKVVVVHGDDRRDIDGANVLVLSPMHHIETRHHRHPGGGGKRRRHFRFQPIRLDRRETVAAGQHRGRPWQVRSTGRGARVEEDG